MKTVYTDYFQKSKVFLYPLLKLKKGIAYVPIQTYVCWEQAYTLNDYMFFCEYHAPSSDKFIKFCDKYLKNHKYFMEHIVFKNNKHLFIFNYKAYKNDYDRFIKGKYSQFSLDTKLIILDFFNSSGNMSDYIHSFLSPDNAHADYANALDISIEKIIDVYEVCSIPDIEKETFQEDNEILNSLLNKNSIYLEK